MSRVLGRFLVLLVGFSLVSALPLSAKDRITAKDIARYYGVACSGTANGAPFAQIGQVDCDASATCVGSLSFNGGGTAVTWGLVGHFTLGPNGVGNIVYDVFPVPGQPAAFQLPIVFVVQDGGRQIRGLPLAPGFDVICNLQEQ